MKIIFPLLNEPFEIRDDKINQIVFESPAAMYGFVNQLYCQMNKQDGDIVLSDNDKIVDLTKGMDLTTDYFPFEINRKSLITKLQANMKSYAINEHIYEINMLMSSIEKIIDDLSECVDCSIEYDEIDIAGIIKLANVRLCNDSDKLHEQVIDYCKNTVSLLGEKVFVFVSLRNYLAEEDFSSFCKMVIDNKLKILLIEDRERDADCLNNLVIDNDLCVI